MKTPKTHNRVNFKCIDRASGSVVLASVSVVRDDTGDFCATAVGNSVLAATRTAMKLVREGNFCQQKIQKSRLDYS